MRSSIGRAAVPRKRCKLCHSVSQQSAWRLKNRRDARCCAIINSIESNRWILDIRWHVTAAFIIAIIVVVFVGLWSGAHSSAFGEIAEDVFGSGMEQEKRLSKLWHGIFQCVFSVHTTTTVTREWLRTSSSSSTEFVSSSVCSSSSFIVCAGLCFDFSCLVLIFDRCAADTTMERSMRTCLCECLTPPFVYRFE